MKKLITNIPGWGKVKVAAKYGGVGERTFRGWLKNGLKHSRLPSGTILVRFSEIDRYLERFVVNNDQVDEIVNEVMEDLT
ncbi:MAG: helix-turn-helix domain-containing protein [bacterium]|nr:MAG: helix-turn-helix domain-containing protein [bacterium]